MERVHTLTQRESKVGIVSGLGVHSSTTYIKVFVVAVIAVGDMRSWISSVHGIFMELCMYLVFHHHPNIFHLSHTMSVCELNSVDDKFTN